MAALQLYENIIAAIDGSLQCEEQSISLFNGIVDGGFLTRVTIRWAVPRGGLEFDGRPHIGSGRTFRVSLFLFRTFAKGPLPKEAGPEFANENPHLATLDLVVRSFEIGKDRKGLAYAEGVFEAPPPKE